MRWRLPRLVTASNASTASVNGASKAVDATPARFKATNAAAAAMVR